MSALNNNNSNDESLIDLTSDTLQTGSSAIDQQPSIPAEWLVEETLSEETLVAMGIDITEIRAQREIERRLEQEAKQQEYAERLQAEFNRERSTLSQLPTPFRAESSTASTPTPITESPRVASVSPAPPRNQLSRLPTVTTVQRAPSNNLSHPVVPLPTNTPRTSKKRTAPSSAKPKRRRARGYWLLPGESMPEFDDDDENSDPDEVPITIGESSSNSNSSTNRAIADIVNASLGRGTNSRPSSSSTTPANSKGKSASMQEISVDEFDQWLDITADNDLPSKIPSGVLDDLNVTLMEHQQTGFKWMYQQELSDRRGGLLCDDMGFGKTIQALAIIVSRRCPNPDPLPHNNLPLSRSPVTQPILAKSTLIVCPVSLMSQWAQEIKNKTKNLSVYIHHGHKRFVLAKDVAPFDVVITSYSILGSEYPSGLHRRSTHDCLFSMTFHRVILDEAHSIKNRNCVQSRACYALKSNYRWGLTATPIQNKLDDIYSLIHFLDIAPLSDYTTFRSEFVLPMAEKNDTEKLDNAKKLLKTFLLRRSKKMMVNGQPILKLPERNVHVTIVEFTPEEQKIYDSVNSSVLAEFNSYRRTSSLAPRYTTVLGLLLRLRKVCLDANLIEFNNPVVPTIAPEHMRIANSIGKKVADRLLSNKDEIPNTECPICMDVADQPQIISGCGHILCRDCLKAYINSNNQYHGGKPCPECRGVLRPETVVPVEIFLKAHTSHNASGRTPNPTNSSTLTKKVTSSKIDTMLNILRKTHQDSNGTDKTIIFSQFSPMMDAISKSLTANNYKHQRYDGTVTVTHRAAIISKFQSDPSITVLLVSTKSGAVGLNMNMANRVLIMDVGWNPLIENQAIDRVHRIGQTKNVEVHRLIVKNTVEERLLELQKRKQDMADGALDGGTKGKGETCTKLGMKEMLYLFCNIPIPETVVAGPSR